MSLNSNEYAISENGEQTEKPTNKKTPTLEKNSTKLYLIILIVSLIIIVAGIILCVVLIKKKEPKQQESPKQKNYILGTYNAQKGVPLKLFNPSKIGLDDESYEIKEILSTNNTRRLQDASITDGAIIPEITGTIQIQIIFNSSLNSLDFLFEGCTDLIKADLTNLNSPSLKSMIYTFTDCSNLVTVDLTSVDSSNIEKMEFLFGGCTNLENIKGFESLNTLSLQKTAGMFIGCQNLKTVNLSSFQLNNISEQNGMFIDNPSLETLDVGNATDINSIFSSEENFNVKIITVSDELNSSELNGQFSSFKREDIQVLNCTKRNWTEFLIKLEANADVYYYIYEHYWNYASQILNDTDNFSFEQEIYDFLKNIKYVDCNSVNNLIYKDFYYFKHKNNYNYSVCEKFKRFYIEFLNEFEKCVECDTEEERRNYCLNCSKGYYVPKGIDYEPTKCRKCEDGCIECVPDNQTDGSICIRCEEEYNSYDDENLYKRKYRLYNGKCIKKCNIGYEEECKSCNEEDGKYDQCSSCNPFYYFDENYSTSECKKIDIEYCIEAVVESGTVICTNCSNGYIIHENKCVRACNIGYLGESCATCNTTYEFRESCGSCRSGYFLAPYNNKTICQSCNEYYYYNNLSNPCKECEYDSGKVKCTECDSDYMLVEGQCLDSCSETCSSCIYEQGKRICNKCIDKYFLKKYDDGNLCEKCSDGCKNCNSEINCTQCLDGYKLITEITNKTQKINDSTFIDIDSDIIWSDDDYSLSNLRILNNNSTTIINSCIKYCITGNYDNCKSCDFNETDKCKDCNPGYYLPYDALTKSRCYSCGPYCLYCLGSMNDPICTQCDTGFYLSDGNCLRACTLGSYDYCKTCDSTNPKNCGSCNDGYYLPIGNYKRYCNYCGSPKIKKCHQEKNYTIIIDECTSDYVLLRNNCVEKCDSQSYFSRCTVCNEEPDKLDQCKECKEGYYLPTDYDNTYCYYCPYPCSSCYGNSYNPTCTSCYDGYILSGGKCLKNCTIGDNNLCKSCNTEPGKIDKCLECNERYYLPRNTNQQSCMSCPNNCKKCEGNNCLECDTGYHLVQNENNEYNYYYNPTYYYSCEQCNIEGCNAYKSDSNLCICIECNTDPSERILYNNSTNAFISCYGGCEIGELDKCKSCANTGGKCAECNNGYSLNSQGKCTSSEFHLLAKYNTTIVNERVKLMASTTIIKMMIDGKIIDNPSYYYTFPLPGEHLVYIKFPSYVSFMDLFYSITHLTYIEFLPNAKSFSINYMNDCFCGCTNLEYADLSNLNLKNNRCFMNFFKGDKNLKEVKFPSEDFSNIYWYYKMFYGCESLTSIDMSRIHNTNGQYFYQMFYGCKNLKFINLSGFNKDYKGSYKYSMFDNVPKDAEIRIHSNFYNSISDQLTEFNNTKIN